MLLKSLDDGSKRHALPSTQPQVEGGHDFNVASDDKHTFLDL